MRLALAFAFLVVAAAPATLGTAQTRGGYLAGQPPIDAVRLLPPPPEAGSSQEAFDRTAAAAARAGVSGPAWEGAIREARIPDAAFMRSLSCAVGVQVSAEKTPAVQKLMMTLMADFVVPMDQAKTTYKRARPFTADGGPACDPLVAAGQGEKLGFSYPSGHAGIGWLLALALSDAAPARSDAIRAWGANVGQHRVDCRVHWPSDVAAGRMLGLAVYDRASKIPAYQADVKAAASEIAKAEPLTCP
ncbi:MAG: phosphatase PAP2 family protein [Phenylobacterium sp.]|nr:phosphatase PAP2 family protein [Phenylobacterium sp.]